MMPNFDSSPQHKLSKFNNFLRHFFLILYPPFESLTPHITIVDMLAHSRRIVSKTDALQGNAYTKTSWLWCLQLSKLQKILKSSACGCVSSNLACCHTCQASQIWHQLSAHENKILVRTVYKTNGFYHACTSKTRPLFYMNGVDIISFRIRADH